MIYVYTDYTENFDNMKRSHFASVKVVAAIRAEDILFADKKFSDLTGIDPAKVDYIWCAPMPEKLFREWTTERLNKKESKIVALKLEIKKLNYTIYGMENPWLKKQPDYMI